MPFTIQYTSDSVKYSDGAIAIQKLLDDRYHREKVYLGRNPSWGPIHFHFDNVCDRFTTDDPGERLWLLLNAPPGYVILEDT